MRSRSLLLLVASALALSGCTSDSADEETSPGGVEPTWTEASLPQSAFPDGPRYFFSDSLPGTRKLPALLGGSSAAPDEASAAALWSGSSNGAWGQKPQLLDLPEGETNVSELASDGEVTLVSGFIRDDGVSQPFVRTSTDRKSWEEVALPEAMVERGLFAAEIVIRADGTPLALGIDDDDVAAAVDLTSGEITDLPAPETSGGLTEIAVANDGDTITVLARQSQEDGTSQQVGYLSTDGGATWTTSGAPAGTSVQISGVVALADGFVATGSQLQGTDDAAAAWFSSEGERWFSESLPPLREHQAGWDTELSAPAADGRSVSAAAMDSEKLFTEALRRGPDGQWSSLGTSTQWIAPNASARVQSLANGGLAVARTWNGQALFSTVSPAGDWRNAGSTFGSEAPLGFWSTLGLDGDTPVLIGGRTVVSIAADGAWTQNTELDRYAFTGPESVDSTPWDPTDSAGLTDLEFATDDDGASVILGQRSLPTESSEEPNAVDLVGWHRGGPQQKWRRVTGLSGPRTEFLTGVDNLDGTWVATGLDRASFVVSDHAYAAVWTSQNGRSWKRAEGRFDVDPGLDSSLSSACRLSTGELLAVGVVEDQQTGTQPLAFRQSAAGKGAWRRADVSGLGPEVQSLSSCVSVGDVALLRGSDRNGQRIWQTTDGKEFEPVEIGGDDDFVLDLQPVAGGFAAVGGRNAGEERGPVIWFSEDGASWDAQPIPSNRDTVSGLVPWGERLVIAMAGTSGPEVLVLENPAEFVGGADVE